MTDEELIKLSRENLRKSRQGSLCECYDEAFIKGYKVSEKRIIELEKENAGLRAGRLKWHDIRKNPDDLPTDKHFKITSDGDIALYDCFWEKWYDLRSDELTYHPAAWCEIPTFNTWLNEDEVKEE